MGKVIAICNQKGGVGKTTTTVSLGVGLVRHGNRVLCIDADPQGDLTTSLGYYNAQNMRSTATLIDMAQSGRLTDVTQIRHAILKHNEGIDVIPSNLSLSTAELQLVSSIGRESMLKKIINPIKDEYDYILIDCMPSLGMITVNALNASDSIIIPVEAQFLAANGMSHLLTTVNQVKEYLNPGLEIEGVLITMYNRTNLAKQASNIIRGNFGDDIRVFDTMIPIATKAAEASAHAQSVFEYDITGTVAAAYDELIKEVTGDGKWMGLSETRASGTEQHLFDSGAER